MNRRLFLPLALIAAGGLLAGGVVWAEPGGVSLPVLAGTLAAYGALCGLVYGWGVEVYGQGGALAATGLVAFLPQTLGAVADGPALLASLLSLAAVYAMARCLLDPTLQGSLLAGAAIAAVLPAAGVAGGSLPSAAASLAAASLLLVVWRVVSTERWESRVRLARAGAVSVALAWATAGIVLLSIASLSTLPSAEEYTRNLGDRYSPLSVRATAARSPLPQHWRERVRVRGPWGGWEWPGDLPLPPPPRFPHPRPLPQAMRERGPELAVSSVKSAPVPRSRGVARVPIVLLLLAALRHWRRARRYADGTWLIAAICLGVPPLVWARDTDFLPAAPFVALLAGAAWDRARAPVLRRGATAAVVVHVLAALFMWPHYPGGAHLPDRPVGRLGSELGVRPEWRA